MQLGLGALPNFQSDMSAAEKNGMKGKAASSRTNEQTGIGAEQNDFQSNLNRDEGRRDVDDQRSDNRDEPVGKIKNRSSDKATAKSGNKTQQDIQSADDYHGRDRILADKNNRENDQEFLFAPNGKEPFDLNFHLTLDSMDTDSQQANGASKEISSMLQSEGDSATFSVRSVNRAEHIMGSAVPDSGISAVLNKENTNSTL